MEYQHLGSTSTAKKAEPLLDLGDKHHEYPDSPHKEDTMEDTRAPVFGSTRMLAYSDAVFSIVITLLVVSLKVDQIDDTRDISSILDIKRLVQFVFAYGVIFIYWDAHVYLFSMFNRIDTAMVLLNGALLLVISFVPYTAGLWFSYHLSVGSTFMFVSAHSLVNLLFIILIGYAWLKPSLVEERHSFLAYATLAAIFLLSILSGLVVLLLAWVVPKWSFLGWVLFPIGQFVGYAVARSCKKRGMEDTVNEGTVLTKRLSTLKLEAERLVAFSDGVYAVGSTLIILDISPPRSAGQESLHVMDRVREEWPGFLSYFFAFSFIFLLWTQHHHIMHHVHSINRSVMRINGIQLISVSLISYAASLVTHLKHDFDNAARFMCLVLFLGGFSQVALWAYVWSAENGQLRIPYKMSVCFYVVLHLLVLPAAAVVVFCLTFLHSYYALIGFLLIPMVYTVLDWCRCADVFGKYIDKHYDS